MEEVIKEFHFDENVVTKQRYIGNYTPENLDKTANDVVKLLLRKNLKISTAESCTGGLVSQIITSVSGASGTIELGVCSYSDRIKNKILSVPQKELDEHTAVSYEVCGYMAKGVRELSDSDISISTTGMAGPTGTPEIPVGTVYIGCSHDGITEVQRLYLEEINDREKVRQHTAYAVFLKLYDILTRD